VSNLFHVIELVHRDEHQAATKRKSGTKANLRIVTVKLVAPSGEHARKVALERYPDYVVLRQTSRPTDLAADPEE
jgi:hypothetical protein